MITPFCREAKQQVCRQKCSPKCSANECALRIGTCCEYECVDNSDAEKPDIPSWSTTPFHTSLSEMTEDARIQEPPLFQNSHSTDNQSQRFDLIEKDTETKFCTNSKQQLCRMRCSPQCSINQCALRIGNCCDYKCVNENKNSNVVLITLCFLLACIVIIGVIWTFNGNKNSWSSV